MMDDSSHKQTMIQNLNLSHIHRILGSGSGVFSGASPLSDPVAVLLIQTVIVLALTRLLSLTGAKLRQPTVIFEIIAGVLLGPSALGQSSMYFTSIFPTALTWGTTVVSGVTVIETINTVEVLYIFSEIGLVFYLFLIGMELDVDKLGGYMKQTGGIAIVGMIVPFCLGLAICPVLYNTLEVAVSDGNPPNYTSYFVFIGTAMCITAFPVLARILKEEGLLYTRVGSIAMAAAAINDALAWCLLVVAISVASAGGSAAAVYVFLTTAAFAAGLYFIVRPRFARLVEFIEAQDSPFLMTNLYVGTIIVLFLCAWFTDLIGLDAIFGAFLFGIIMPRESQLFSTCLSTIEKFVITTMLPLYFAYSGLNANFTQLSSGPQVAVIVLVCAMASLGKFIGAGIPAYLAGSTVREAATVASLMNTRGLVELIVLNLGKQFGILSVASFSVMVIMCLFTTFITCPLVNYLYPAKYRILATAKDDFEDTGALTGPQEDDGAADAITSTGTLTRPNNHGAGDIVMKSLSSISSMQSGQSVTYSGDFIAQAQAMKLSVVVSRFEQVQPAMELLSFFLPASGLNTSTKHPEDGERSLAVQSFHLHEPRFDESDVYVAANESGRRVNCSEETLDSAAAAYSARNREGLIMSPLLPLLMFCRAIGTAPNTSRCYTLRGDAAEYPAVVRRLAQGEHNSQLVVLPWRINQSFERFFWDLRSRSHVPLAVLVQADVEPPAEAAADGTRGTISLQNARSSQAPRKSALNLDRPSMGFGAVFGSQRPSTAVASAREQFAASFSSNQNDIETADAGKRSTPQQLNVISSRNSAASVMGGRASNMSTNNNNNNNTSSKSLSASRTSQKVLAILTGSPADHTILSMVTRMLHNPELRLVQVFVPKDVVEKARGQPIERDLARFETLRHRLEKEKVGSHSHCKAELILSEHIASDEIEELLTVATAQSFDLCVIGFVSSHSSTQAPPQLRSTAANVVSVEEFRYLIGVPDSLCDHNVLHPELGEISEKLLQLMAIPRLLVVHSPEKILQRRRGATATNNVNASNTGDASVGTTRPTVSYPNVGNQTINALHTT